MKSCRRFCCVVALLAYTAGCQNPRGVPSSVGAGPAVASGTDRFWPNDGAFPVPGRTSSWSGFRAKNVERRALFAQRQAQDQGAVVFVGDSITEGWKTLEPDFADLGVKIANRGIGGDTTPNLVYRLNDDVLALRPRALVILMGTNDLGEGTSPAQIAGNLRETHARVRAVAPEIPIVWCLVMPRGEQGYLERIRALNAEIVELAKADPRASVCDTFTPLALPDGSPKPEAYAPDRLHLNAAGYELWHAALRPILTRWKRR